MKKIFGFGTVALDLRCRTADLGKGYTGKLLVRDAEILSGGAAANALVQAARLGGYAVYLGRLGRDEIGKRILDNLGAEEVRTEGIVFEDGEISPFNVAVYAGGERRRIGGYLLPNSLSRVGSEDVKRFAEGFSAGDILLVEIGEVPLESCSELCVRASEKGVKILMDVDLDPVAQCGASAGEAKRLLALADYLMPNVESLGGLYEAAGTEEPARGNAVGTEEPARGNAAGAEEPVRGNAAGTEKLAQTIAAETGASVIITEGDKGCVFCGPGGEAERQPCFRTDVVDTVGAGDAFHGSFAYALTLGYDLRTAVEFASFCAAQNCRAFGAAVAMIRRDEAEKVWDFGAGRFR